MHFQGKTSNKILEQSESKLLRQILTSSSKKVKKESDSKILRRFLTMTRAEMKKEKEKYFIPTKHSNIMTNKDRNNDGTNKMFVIRTILSDSDSKHFYPKTPNDLITTCRVPYKTKHVSSSNLSNNANTSEMRTEFLGQINGKCSSRPLNSNYYDKVHSLEVSEDTLQKHLLNVGCEKYKYAREECSGGNFSDAYSKLCDRTYSHLGYNINTDCNTSWCPPQLPLPNVVYTAKTQPSQPHVTDRCNCYRPSFRYEDCIKDPSEKLSRYHEDSKNGNPYKPKRMNCCVSRYCTFENIGPENLKIPWNGCDILDPSPSKIFKGKMDTYMSSKHMYHNNIEKKVAYEIKKNQIIVGFRNNKAPIYKENEALYPSQRHSLALPPQLPSQSYIDTIVSNFIKNNYDAVN